EARATFPALAGGRLWFDAYASRRDYPMERYFGAGPDSERSNETNYLLLTNQAGASAGVRPVSTVLLGGGLDYIDPYVGSGRVDNIPTVEQRFDERSAPGLLRQPTFLKSHAFAVFDNRRPRNLRKGGLYRIDYSHYDDRDDHAYSFNRIDVD